MKYNKYSYKYPPRPEIQIHPQDLYEMEKFDFLAQPKLNGSCMMLYTNGNEAIVMNRRKEKLVHKLNIDELKSLHRGKGWMVLVGELMNKNKKDENNTHWNHKFVIFDMIVYNGEYLLRSTFDERFKMLEKLYPTNEVKPFISEISENCFRVISLYENFNNTWNKIVKFDMYEGLVLKKIDGKLEQGISASNNTRTQLKCRKPTKNYTF